MINKTDKIESPWQKFDALPANAKRQVIDFIAFLQIRYQRLVLFKKTKRLKLSEEPFVGIWQDREDLSDSVAWVRETRRREWKA
ncbi:MAG: DUF2281 domain-containing protein [bacterium]|jgi:hypothetical protein|nr:DUF2281 domain-containing protein [bacterium]